MKRDKNPFLTQYHSRFTTLLRGVIISTALGLVACSSEPPSSTEIKITKFNDHSPPTTSGHNPIRNAYFGDLHVHTRNSYDAYLFNVRTTPDDAYSYAKGDSIKHTAGFELQLNSGALDFLAVTDHAEYMGVLEEVETPGTEYSKVPYAQDLFSSERAKIFAAFGVFVDSMTSGDILPEFSDLKATQSAWQETIDAAQRHNNPGEFTTFIGYEYTSLPDFKNLHRNVIFADANVPELPFSTLDSSNPEDLWQWLDRQREQGIEALAIPHNSNASDGAMFDTTTWDGSPIDAGYAKLRARNEPLVEIIQIKGQSETMPLLSTNDEFADFELMTSYIGNVKPITKFSGGYVRDALKRGLELEFSIAENPYSMGFIGSSDGHNSAGPFEENNYFSKVGALDARPEQRGSVPPNGNKQWPPTIPKQSKPKLSSTWGTGGLTGVWAEENTRASIYAALRRKETFATSGPRIRVRMFAGEDLANIDITNTPGITKAYAQGVPMGATLTLDEQHFPEFKVIALKDVNSAALQRIQIIKGWTDINGKAHEKVVDIACSDNLTVDPITNRCPDNGARVNIEDCSITAHKGNTQIQGYWKDTDYRPYQNAFYYARVLENPTCRWSTWDAVRANVPPNPLLAKTIQERAFTSPIWIKATNLTPLQTTE